MPSRGWVNRLGDCLAASAGAAVVGLGFGLFELVNLLLGRVEVRGLDATTIVLIHIGVALACGLPVIFVGALWEALVKSKADPTDCDGLFPRRLSSVVAFWVLGCMLLLELRLRLLPATFSRTTLIVAGLIFLVALLGWGIWTRRPWGRRVDGVAVGLLVVATLIAVVSAARGGRPDEQARPRPPVGEAEGRPDVFLILVDTLRADHLGVYGYDRPTSPALDRLASQGMVFDNAFSASNWTRPAVASMLTSTIPSVHGVVQLDRAVPPTLPLLAEALRDLGYRTAVVAPGASVAAQDGYARGVDWADFGRPRNALTRTPIGGKIVVRAWDRLIGGLGRRQAGQPDPAVLAAGAAEWAGMQPEESPVFVYLHLPGPHAPYLPPPEYAGSFSNQSPTVALSEPPRRKWAGRDWIGAAQRAQMVAQYDGEVLWHDEVIDGFLEGLRRQGRLENAYVFVTADHGEGFGEHEVWGHAVSLFDEITRVPLVVWRSPAWEAPGRIAAPASLIDIAPTIMDLAGGVSPGSFQGGSLAPWLRGEASERGRQIVLENPLYDEAGVRTDDWVFWRGRRGILGEDQGRWLYRATDRLQATNLADELSSEATRLEDLLDTHLAGLRLLDAEAEDIVLDDERLQKLKALGYVD